MAILEFQWKCVLCRKLENNSVMIFEYLSSKLIYVNSGATRPRTPRCCYIYNSIQGVRRDIVGKRQNN